MNLFTLPRAGTQIVVLCGRFFNQNLVHWQFSISQEPSARSRCFIVLEVVKWPKSKCRPSNLNMKLQSSCLGNKARTSGAGQTGKANLNTGSDCRGGQQPIDLLDASEWAYFRDTDTVRKSTGKYQSISGSDMTLWKCEWNPAEAVAEQRCAHWLAQSNSLVWVIKWRQ